MTGAEPQYRVLLPVAGDEADAIRQAKFVADLPCANEEVVVSIRFVFTDESWPRPVPSELKQFESADRVGSVRRTVDHLEAADIEYDIIEESGDVATDIVNVAEDVDPELVVVGGRKESRTGKVLFGSVTQSVLFESEQTVAIVGSE